MHERTARSKPIAYAAPSVVIVLAIESEPRLHLDVANDGEADRLVAWLNSRDDLAELVGRALDLEAAA